MFISRLPTVEILVTRSNKHLSITILSVYKSSTLWSLTLFPGLHHSVFVYLLLTRVVLFLQPFHTRLPLKPALHSKSAVLFSERTHPPQMIWIVGYYYLQIRQMHLNPKPVFAFLDSLMKIMSLTLNFFIWGWSGNNYVIELLWRLSNNLIGLLLYILMICTTGMMPRT